MPLKNDSDQKAQSSLDLFFTLALFDYIDTQFCLLAEKVDKDPRTHYLYAVFDSLSSAGSMYRWLCTIYLASNDSDVLHNAMMTPGSIIAVLGETLFLILFSVLAYKFDSEANKNQQAAYKRFIITGWMYFRDIMKGLKNVYKGWSSAIIVAGLIGGLNISYLITPIGLFLGIFAAGNRVWLRWMLEDRKTMMQANLKLAEEIKKLKTLSPLEKRIYLNQIHYQSNFKRGLAYLSVAIGGVLDGLYLYVGALCLVVITSPVFPVLTGVCALYTLACVITRVYEEYEFQRRLIVTQTKTKLELSALELKCRYAEWLVLYRQSNTNITDIAKLHELEKALLNNLKEFDTLRSILKKQSKHSLFTAFLMGLRNGLYAYGALASVLFAVSAILILAGTSFPPILLIVSIFIGLALLIGFISHSLISNYGRLKLIEKQEKIERPFNTLVDLNHQIKLNLEKNKVLDEERFNQCVQDGLDITPFPLSLAQERFEVIRSLFAGFGKGKNFAEFAGNPLLEPDESGHFHDSNVLRIIAVLCSALFGLILALRALAKGLGRVPLGQQKATAIPPTTPSITKPLPQASNQTKDPKHSEEHESSTQSAVLINQEQTQGSAKEPDKPRETSSCWPHFSLNTTALSFFKPKPSITPKNASSLTLLDSTHSTLKRNEVSRANACSVN